MTRTTSNVLVDRLSATQSVTSDLLWIVSFSLLTSVLAQVSIPLPFTPVPLTGQTFAVLLSGAVLGWRRGFLSQALYLAEGAAGLPVFAGGGATAVHLFGPSGGYLWSFPLAAAFIGWLVERGAGRAGWKLAGALVASDTAILLVGSWWLHAFFHMPYSQALLLGFYPFLVGDILKIVVVGSSLPRILRRLDASR
jgi:biotin transport system substrate-specific component